jgi:hypothetical protein
MVHFPFLPHPLFAIVESLKKLSIPNFIVEILQIQCNSSNFKGCILPEKIRSSADVPALDPLKCSTTKSQTLRY